MTTVISIDPKKPDKSKIAKAAKILSQGKTVAIPTETVYGLAANALDEEAVKKIFAAKGRPSDNPLIVHISDRKQLQALTTEISPLAEQLMDAFWPGPLTILFHKTEIVPDITTAGLDTVAVRMPHHKIALPLIRMAAVPLAAPSANLSGKPSPTEGAHVIADLTGKIDAIIDGGKCDIGVESTVVHIKDDAIHILRPGGVTKEQLETICPKVHTEPTDGVARSPGMKYTHYSPEAEVIVCSADKIQTLVNEHKGRVIGVIGLEKFSLDVSEITICADLYEYAQKMFDLFRIYEKKNVELIIVQSVEEDGLGHAIMNRVKKAASKVIE